MAEQKQSAVLRRNRTAAEEIQDRFLRSRKDDNISREELTNFLKDFVEIERETIMNVFQNGVLMKERLSPEEYYDRTFGKSTNVVTPDPHKLVQFTYIWEQQYEERGFGRYSSTTMRTRYYTTTAIGYMVEREDKRLFVYCGGQNHSAGFVEHQKVTSWKYVPEEVAHAFSDVLGHNRVIALGSLGENEHLEEQLAVAEAFARVYRKFIDAGLIVAAATGWRENIIEEEKPKSKSKKKKEPEPEKKYMRELNIVELIEQTYTNIRRQPNIIHRRDGSGLFFYVHGSGSIVAEGYFDWDKVGLRESGIYDKAFGLEPDKRTRDKVSFEKMCMSMEQVESLDAIITTYVSGSTAEGVSFTYPDIIEKYSGSVEALEVAFKEDKYTEVFSMSENKDNGEVFHGGWRYWFGGEGWDEGMQPSLPQISKYVKLVGTPKYVILGKSTGRDLSDKERYWMFDVEKEAIVGIGHNTFYDYIRGKVKGPDGEQVFGQVLQTSYNESNAEDEANRIVTKLKKIFSVISKEQSITVGWATGLGWFNFVFGFGTDNLRVFKVGDRYFRFRGPYVRNKQRPFVEVKMDGRGLMEMRLADEFYSDSIGYKELAAYIIKDGSKQLEIKNFGVKYPVKVLTATSGWFKKIEVQSNYRY